MGLRGKEIELKDSCDSGDTSSKVWGPNTRSPGRRIDLSFVRVGGHTPDGPANATAFRGVTRLNPSGPARGSEGKDGAPFVKADCSAPGGTQPSQTTPAAMVRTVSGAPTLEYSQKLIRTSWRARCTTIRFATDPRMVRLPASVVDIASVSQLRIGSLMCAMNGLQTRTAGTLLTKFESRVAITLSTEVRSGWNCCAKWNRFSGREVFSTPATTMKSPIKRTSSVLPAA